MVYYYAELENGIVQELRVVADAVLETEDGLDETRGAELLASLYGGQPSDYVRCRVSGDYRQTARPGYTYDEARDAFIPPKPFESWVLDEDTCLWVAPVPMPEETDADGNPVPYVWDEDAGDWVVVDGGS